MRRIRSFCYLSFLLFFVGCSDVLFVSGIVSQSYVFYNTIRFNDENRFMSLDETNANLPLFDVKTAPSQPLLTFQRTLGIYSCKLKVTYVNDNHIEQEFVIPGSFDLNSDRTARCIAATDGMLENVPVILEIIRGTGSVMGRIPIVKFTPRY